MNTLTAKSDDKDVISSKINIRENILKVEVAMRKLPNAMLGDCFPLKHSYAEGMYIREISVPKGYLVITKIHKFSHPCFILEGDCSVLSEEGIKRIKAPYYMITPAGTKRVVYVHENTVWVTCHNTKEVDLEKIEEEIIVKSFDDLSNNIIDINIEGFIAEAKKGDKNETLA